MSLLTSLVLVGVGLLLAFAGRRYVWLLVAATGFLLAFWVVNMLLPDSLVGLLLALAAGLVAAFLVKGVTQIVLMLAGFVFVGTAAAAVGAWFGFQPGSVQWILIFLVGGVLGIVLARFVLGVGLMIITALGGAAMVVIGLPDLGLPIAGLAADLVGPVVAIAGFFVQSTASRSA